MRGDTLFYNVYQDIFNLCMVEQLSFTKEDIENMPPFERMGYSDLVDKYYEELEAKREEERQKQKSRM